MLEHGIKPEESWNNAPTWVQDKWAKQFCSSDADVMSKACIPWLTCCQMVEEYGIEPWDTWNNPYNGTSNVDQWVRDRWTNAPQWVRDKWTIHQCNEQDDIKSNSCGRSKVFGTHSNFFIQYTNNSHKNYIISSSKLIQICCFIFAHQILCHGRNTQLTIVQKNINMTIPIKAF